MKISLGTILTIAQVIPGIVDSVQRIFGKGNGAQKKQAAKDAATDIIMAVEGVAGKDLVDDQRVQNLLDEAIELGVSQMKIVARLREIDEDIKALRAAKDAA
ncbi:MAG: hypothetical protein ABS36_11070 [Acidobacteria bacterium SCN 69-37]|mgnify:CR=1 FL=1|nr:MAG: hypothetical protein ABS36_11070 [Acidobacteria bacterium SCN 69-37]